MPTIVSPSPRELFARLSDEEKVAVDFLLQEDGDVAVLSALVVDSKRRDHLRGLVTQLKALGFSVQDSPELDQQREIWEAARARFAEEMNQRLRERADEQAREQAREQQRLQALPPEARRAVERRRRRRARRGGRP